jgi:hypothetical protein
LSAAELSEKSGLLRLGRSALKACGDVEPVEGIAELDEDVKLGVVVQLGVQCKRDSL